MTPEARVPPTRSPWKWLLRLAIGLGLVALLVHQRGTATGVLNSLRRVPPLDLAAAVLVYWAGQFLCAVKWQMLLRAQGVRAPLRACCQIYFAGMFGNLWLPTNIGGDALRVYLLRRAVNSAGVAQGALSVVMDRLTGLLALLVLGGIGLALDPNRPAWHGPGLGPWAQGFAVVFLLGFGLWMGYRVTRRPSSSNADHKPGKLAHLATLTMPYRTAAGLRALVLPGVLALIFQVSQVLINLGFARAVGLHLTPVSLWWLIPGLAVAGFVPLGIGGLGVREGAAVVLIGATGNHAPLGLIVGWSLLWQSTVWLASLPGGLFLRPLGKRASEPSVGTGE